MTATLFLASDEISGLAAPTRYIAVVREGYRQRDEGAPAEPRAKLLNREPSGVFTTYAAVLSKTGTMSGRMYSVGFGAEDAWFMTSLFDVQNGRPLALLDDAGMDPFKIGMISGVAVNVLARNDASTLALTENGAQARGQLRTAAVVRDLDSVQVYPPAKENRESFAGEIDRMPDANVAAVTSSTVAVESADIVAMTTAVTDPVFDSDPFDPDMHVAATDQYYLEKREFDGTTTEHATYVPNLRERTTVGAGSSPAVIETGIIDEDHTHVELGEVVTGAVAGREDGEEITAFNSGGMGIETTVAVHILYEKTHEEGLGTTIDFSSVGEPLIGQ